MFNVTEYIQTTFLSKNQADFSSHAHVHHGYDFVMNFCSEYTGNISYDHYMENGDKSFLYYCPGDCQNVLYDFSYVDKNEILIVDGATEKVFGSREIITRLTVEDFLKKHGYKMMVSVAHYKVSWGIFGGWNN